MTEYSKREMKVLRRWVEEAWKRELDAELKVLSQEFDRWTAGEITAFDLEHRIHEFHDGIARDLYKFYTRSKPPMAVAHGLADGWIQSHELPEELARKLKSLVKYLAESES